MNDLTQWLSGGMDPDEAMMRETLRLHVVRQITCPVTGTVLNIKDAVLIEVNGGGKVISGQAWDELADDVLSGCAELGITPRVTDARLMLWGDRATDFEELGVYRDVMTHFAGDTAFARWCANRYPWGNFDLTHERQAYELLHRFTEGDAVRLRHPWEDLPAGTTGRTVGRPYELYRQPISPVQFIELDDRRRVVVPLGHLEPAPDPQDEGGHEDGQEVSDPEPEPPDAA